jgi:hypothetical protein
MSIACAALLSFATALPAAPPASEKPQYARWMASSTTWGYLSTISTRTEATSIGAPFGNPYSFAEVGGVPYFYASDLDASMIDLFTSSSPKANPRATFALSEATLVEPNGTAALAACRIGAGLGDPENPPCARLVLSGVVSKVAPKSHEEQVATKALFARHPSFKHYPAGHDFFVAKMSIDAIWLIDFYGGAANIKPADYFKNAYVSAPSKSLDFVVQMAKAKKGPPPYWKKPATARWMVQELSWGVVSTLSTRSEGARVGDAFGNPYSFADVRGTPYFYASSLDASMTDLFSGTNASTRASFTLSEAALNSRGILHNQACEIGTYLGDPENPPCARLQLGGTVSKLVANSTEEVAARKSLFTRHPSFANYPSSHDFFVAKLELDGIWLIDMYGGAAIISPTEYFNATVDEVPAVVML